MADNRSCLFLQIKRTSSHDGGGSEVSIWVQAGRGDVYEMLAT